MSLSPQCRYLPFAFIMDDGNDDWDPAWAMDVHTAASVGDIDLLTAEAAKGESLDAINASKWTPLMYACYYDHASTVDLLRASGSTSLAQNDRGRSALMLAAMCGNEDSARVVLQGHGRREQVGLRDGDGLTALFHACGCGHASVARMLLDNDSDANAVETTKCYSPLMWASKEGHEEIVRILIHYGANVSYANILGETARSLAATRGHDRVVALLGHSTPPASILDAPALASKRMQDRSAGQLEVFLAEAGVAKYAHLFEERKVELAQVLRMSDQDLVEMGVTLLGPRRKLTSAIARVRQETQK